MRGGEREKSVVGYIVSPFSSYSIPIFFFPLPPLFRLCYVFRLFPNLSTKLYNRRHMVFFPYFGIYSQDQVGTRHIVVFISWSKALETYQCWPKFRTLVEDFIFQQMLNKLYVNLNQISIKFPLNSTALFLLSALRTPISLQPNPPNRSMWRQSLGSYGS